MDKSELLRSLSRIEFWRDWFFAPLVAIGIIGEVVLGWIYVTRSKALHAAEEDDTRSLNLSIETLRKENLKLESRLAPRSLSPQSSAFIMNAMKVFPNQKFDILWYTDDQDSINLAQQIAEILTDAGWTLDRSDEWLGFGLVMGISIEFAPSKSAEFEPAADALAAALTEEGIIAVSNANPEQDEADRFPDRIRIKVGKKP